MEVRDLEVLAWRLLEESNDAVFILDPETETIQQANPAAQRLTGLRWRQLRNRCLDDFVHSDHDRQLTNLLSAVRETGFFHSQEEYLLNCPSSDAIPINISVTRVHTPSRAIGLVVARDISDRKRAERALREFNQELERQVLLQTEKLRELNASLEQRVAERTAELAETNAELTAFAHTVSHDLRAPLRAMEGFATALSEEYGERFDEKGHEFIRYIVESAQRMDQLVSDLLTYSRLSREKLSIHSVSLNAIVNEALIQLKADIESCNATVEVAEPMATVLGHRSTIVHVVTNLLSNAIKFVAPHVRPEVRLRTEKKSNGSIRLWVEDNGIGIDAEYQDRIFCVFERLHGIESYPGTGIGLAVVARACGRLEGRCGVESQLGQGSRFWVEFPEGEVNW